MNEKLESVLDQFRPGFDANGFDVSVQDLVGGVVAVRIVHRPDACEYVRIEHVGRPSA